MVVLISRDVSDSLPIGSMRKRVNISTTVSLIYCTYSEASKDNCPTQWEVKPHTNPLSSIRVTIQPAMLGADDARFING
jgi:hypothetical protein